MVIMKYKLLTKTTLPSYGYWIKKWKATSLFEAWDITRNIGDASLNHPSMGNVSAWMIKSLAGINVDESEVAFKKIVIKPSFIEDLSYVKGHHQSIKGLISTEWKRNGATVDLKVTIPANCEALIVLPGKEIEVKAGEFRFQINQK
jgi:alpha-L-rhamnosidase